MKSSSAIIFTLFFASIFLVGMWSVLSVDIKDEVSIAQKWKNTRATVKSDCDGNSIATTKSISLAEVNVDKTSSVAVAHRLDEFEYIINYSCTSLTQHCDEVVIVDTLPTGMAYIVASSSTPGTAINISGNIITATFTQGNGTGLDAGSTGQLVIRVVIRNSATFGEKINTATISSSNGGINQESDTITIVSEDVVTDYTYVEGFSFNKYHWMDIMPHGFAEYGITPFNLGLNTVNNISIIDTFPQEFVLHNIFVTEVPGTSANYTISVKLENDLNNWIPIITGNTGASEFHNIDSFGFPNGVEVAHIRIEIDALEGGGNFHIENPNFLNVILTGQFPEIGRDGDTLRIGDVITNCAYGTSDTNDFADCDSGTVTIPTNTSRYFKWDNIASAEFSAGVPFTYTVSGGLMRYSALPDSNYAIHDLLPIEVEYVPGTWAMDDVPFAGFPDPHFEEIQNWNGTGRTMLRWVWNDAHGNNFTLRPNPEYFLRFSIQFRAMIKNGVPSGTLVRNCNGLFSAEQRTNYNTQDVLDLDEDGDTDEIYGQECTEVTVAQAPFSSAIQATKFVIGTLDTAYSRFPNIGRTVLGGVDDYIITIENPSTTDITNLVAIDVFPHVNDTGVLDANQRESDWGPVLASSIIPPAGVTVEYTTVPIPCRDELEFPSDGIPNNFPVGCIDANWSLVPPLDLTAVTAIRYDFGNIVLSPQDSINLFWSMRTPLSAPINTIAWNSFAYSSTDASTGDKLLPAEPIKVGVTVVPDPNASLGDRIWVDLNNDGIQDANESGLDGVIVELYHDSNGNNSYEPGFGDLLVGNTITNDGGLFLFPNLDPGSYYIRYYPNSIYTLSPANSGADDSVDSDASLVSIDASNAVLSPIANLAAGQRENSFDLGLRTPSIIIQGTVFEDINYGGGDGRNYTVANTSAQTSGFANGEIGVEDAIVELYSATGAFIETTITDVNGDYTLSAPIVGNYFVRVVNESVVSNRASNSTSEPTYAVQTFKSDGFVENVDEVGGSVPQLEDADANTAMLNLSSLSSSTNTVQSLSPVLVNGSTLTDVDFGFNFDVVVNTNDSGQGSLRQFIHNSNELNNANLDQEDAPTNGIHFDKMPGWETSIFMIDGPGVHVIEPISPLESIRDPRTHVTAYTQEGSVQGTIENRTINVELNGNDQLFDAINIITSEVQVSGFSIHNFRRGIYGNGTGTVDNFIWGNYIGTLADGVTAAPNSDIAASYQRVNNSFIGTNGDNINDANEGNLLSNSFYGTELQSTENVLVAGNYVGTDKYGTSDQGNQFIGVHLRDATGPNFIGFYDALNNTDRLELQNILSGNGTDGVRLTNSDEQVISGNFIGTDVTGTVAIPNVNYGIQFIGTTNNNIVGTNSNGVNDLSERNLISGNGNGIRFINSGIGDNNVVSGNFIGTDFTGNNPLGNNLIGLEIAGPGFTNTVIGTNGDNVNDSVERNVISSNGSDGIRLANAMDVLIAGNNIGLGADGVSNVGNTSRGIFVAVNSDNNNIGYHSGLSNTNELEVGNFIYYNGTSGIETSGGTQNRFSRNQIALNGALGIDLGQDLVTANDNLDTDSGSNDLLNFPVIESVHLVGTQIIISGFAPANAEIEFFVADGENNPNPIPSSHSTSFGEGETYLFTAFEGTTSDTDASTGSYTDDGTGNTTTKTQNRFRFTFDNSTLGLTAGTAITSSATNSLNNTSEFSGVMTAITCDLPTINGVPGGVNAECDNVPSPPVLGVEVTASSNCFTPTIIMIEDTTGAFPHAYFLRRIWIAENDIGITRDTQVIVVLDTTRPVLSGVPADETVSCGGTPAPAPTLTVSDNCDPDVSVVLSEVSSESSVDCSTSYTITRTWTARDVCANSRVARQVITIEEDAIAPTITGVPVDETVECDAIPVVDQSLISASDNCDTNVDIAYTENTINSLCERFAERQRQIDAQQ